jgi:hypothetical protein
MQIIKKLFIKKKNLYFIIIKIVKYWYIIEDMKKKNMKDLAIDCEEDRTKNIKAGNRGEIDQQHAKRGRDLKICEEICVGVDVEDSRYMNKKNT